MHHKLLVCDKPVKPIQILPRRKTLKLKDDGIGERFEQKVTTKSQIIPAGVENSWKSIKNGLLEDTDKICGLAWGGCQLYKEI